MLSSNLLLINPQCNAVVQWVGLVRIEESCPSFPPPPLLPSSSPYLCPLNVDGPKKRERTEEKMKEPLLTPYNPRQLC